MLWESRYEQSRKPSKRNSFGKCTVCVLVALGSLPAPWPLRSTARFPPCPTMLCDEAPAPAQILLLLWDPGWGVKSALGLATGTVIAACHATSRHISCANAVSRPSCNFQASVSASFPEPQNLLMLRNGLQNFTWVYWEHTSRERSRSSSFLGDPATAPFL